MDTAVYQGVSGYQPPGAPAPGRYVVTISRSDHVETWVIDFREALSPTDHGGVIVVLRRGVEVAQGQGASGKEIAEAAHISESSLCRLRKKDRLLDLEDAARLGAYFDLSIIGSDQYIFLNQMRKMFDEIKAWDQRGVHLRHFTQELLRRAQKWGGRTSLRTIAEGSDLPVSVLSSFLKEGDGKRRNLRLPSLEKLFRYFKIRIGPDVGDAKGEGYVIGSKVIAPRTWVMKRDAGDYSVTMVFLCILPLDVILLLVLSFARGTTPREPRMRFSKAA
jgi:hypothetical protein